MAKKQQHSLHLKPSRQFTVALDESSVEYGLWDTLQTLNIPWALEMKAQIPVEELVEKSVPTVGHISNKKQVNMGPTKNPKYNSFRCSSHMTLSRPRLLRCKQL